MRAITLALCLLAVSCGGSSEPEAVTPEPSVAWPYGIDSGTATVNMSGDLSGTFTVNGKRTTQTLTSPDPHTLAQFVWESDTAGMKLVAIPFSGTQPTRPGSIELSFLVQHRGGLVEVGSRDGECEITVQASDGTGLAGSYRCERIDHPDPPLSLSVHGTFEAIENTQPATGPTQPQPMPGP